MSRVVEISRGLKDRFTGLLRLRASEEPSGGRQKPGAPKRSGPPGPGLPNGQGQPQSRGLFTMVAVIALFVVLFMMFSAPNRAEPITLHQFRIEYEGNMLSDVTLTDEGLRAKRKKDVAGPEGYVLVKINSANRELIAKEANEITKGNFQSNSPSAWLTILVFFGPLLLILFLGWWLVSRGLRAAAGGGGMLGNFGKSRHRTLTKEMTGITFADVAGIDEAKEEVTEIIEFLKNPKKFTKLGGRIPRGVLLVGEPGCGKTLLAKAIAGEADVPFFSISGSDFVEMFVGVGASRVRDLFKQAKDSSPCIIFLDEIDAVGRRRGGGFTTGGHDEREQTLNAILVEMDGFNTADGVIVIAATNRNDVLDPALTRPGRFDRQITVPLPDVKGRLEILRVHSKKVKMGPNVELERIARGTPMFSGADLAAIINEAAIAATMQNKDFIEHEDLEEARDKVKFGRAKKSRVREKDENKLVAYHEAGHAILQALLTDADPLHKVTIIPRGGAGGATFSLPEKDRMGYGIKWLNATMRVLCGGRIAEQKAMSDASSGASMDITQVTSLARTMIVEWGMSRKLGFVRYAGMDTREMYMAEKGYSEETAKQIDEEVRRFVDEAYADAQRLLEENWDKVVRVADALIKYETLSADDVHRLMRGEELAKPTVADLLRAEAARRKADTPPSLPPEASTDLPPGALPNPA
ncbi:MAG: ATP-dependent zinc metalloprotease FtsH [Phycisphaerae bacterium]|nr:ATP-dependent zinc metalloprotease FtsH [Phycisphaerae bacterium]MBN8598233.1 ATP-dependent zinc metalloprotease FtsH [Planctomycetota bacterium]